jgi:hypothetical protein
MNIGVFLESCLATNTIVFNNEMLETLLSDFFSCLKKSLAELPPSDYSAIMKIYLYLIGFEEIDVLPHLGYIKLSYALPFSIKTQGIATFVQDIERGRQVIRSNKDVNFILFFSQGEDLKEIETENRIKVVLLNDISLMYFSIIIMRLYRDLSYRFEQDPKYSRWYFKFIEKRWGLTKSFLFEAEKRWLICPDTTDIRWNKT